MHQLWHTHTKTSKGPQPPEMEREEEEGKKIGNRWHLFTLPWQLIQWCAPTHAPTHWLLCHLLENRWTLASFPPSRCAAAAGSPAHWAARVGGGYTVRLSPSHCILIFFKLHYPTLGPFQCSCILLRQIIPQVTRYICNWGLFHARIWTPHDDRERGWLGSESLTAQLAFSGGGATITIAWIPLNINYVIVKLEISTHKKPTGV